MSRSAIGQLVYALAAAALVAAQSAVEQAKAVVLRAEASVGEAQAAARAAYSSPICIATTARRT